MLGVRSGHGKTLKGKGSEFTLLCPTRTRLLIHQVLLRYEVLGPISTPVTVAVPIPVPFAP